MGIYQCCHQNSIEGIIGVFTIYNTAGILLQLLQEMIHMYNNNQELQCCPDFYQLLLFDKIVADLETLVMSATNKVTNTKLPLSLAFHGYLANYIIISYGNKQVGLAFQR